MKAEGRIIDIDQIGRWPGFFCHIKPRLCSPQEMEEKIKNIYRNFYSYSSMWRRLPLPLTKAHIASWAINWSQRKIFGKGGRENFEDF